MLGDVGEYLVIEVSAPIQSLWIKPLEGPRREFWSGEDLSPSPVVVGNELSKEINKNIFFKNNIPIPKCALERTSGWGVVSDIELLREDNPRVLNY